MSFLTQLNPASYKILHQLIVEKLLNGEYKEKQLFQIPPSPGDNYDLVSHFWIERGKFPVQDASEYILTPSVISNMRNLVRVIVAKNYPVLIQVFFIFLFFIYLFIYLFFCN